MSLPWLPVVATPQIFGLGDCVRLMFTLLAGLIPVSMKLYELMMKLKLMPMKLS